MLRRPERRLFGSHRRRRARRGGVRGQRGPLRGRPVAHPRGRGRRVHRGEQLDVESRVRRHFPARLLLRPGGRSLVSAHTAD